MDENTLLPFILPLFGALLLIVSGIFAGASPWRKLVRTVSLALSYGASTVLAVANILSSPSTGYIGGYHSNIAIRYEITPVLSAVYILALFITFICDLYAGDTMREKPGIAAVIHIQLAFIGFTLITRDLFNLFVTLEVLGITSYLLIASGEKYRASLASLSYLLVSSCAMTLFLLGVYGIYRETGSLDMFVITEYYQVNESSTLSHVSIACLAVALLLRTAVFPLHAWLPEAHASAPHHVSALLSGLLIKIPLFPLALIVNLAPASRILATILLYAGAFSAIYAVISAFSQRDMKRLLAYHSISQMGYVVSSFGAFLITGKTELLYIAALLHLTFHALFKSTLFLSLGRVIDLGHDRNVYTVRNGADTLLLSSRRNVFVIIAYFLSALSIAATPATNAFISKQLITDALKDNPLASAALVITGAFTVASFIKLSRIFLPDREKPILSVRRENRGISAMILSIIFLLASSVGEHLILSLPILSSFHPYSPSHLLKTSLSIGAGILLYSTITLKPVRNALHRICDFRPSLTWTLISVPLSSAVLALILQISHASAFL